MKSINFSVIEIYGKQANCLISGSQNLKLKKDSLGNSVFENCENKSVKLSDKVCFLETVLSTLKRRKVGSTLANQQSSRSHLIFTFKIVRSSESSLNFSSFNIIDLAGSERQSETEA